MTQENRPETNRTKSSQEIEAEIGETRSGINADIKALSDKMSPAHLKQEAKQALGNAADSTMHAAVDKAVEMKDVAVEKIVELRDAAAETVVEATDTAREKLHEAADTAAETMEAVADQTRRISQAAWRFTAANAVPLTLIGVGAGWLILNGRSGRSEREALQSGIGPQPGDASDGYDTRRAAVRAATLLRLVRGHPRAMATGRAARGTRAAGSAMSEPAQALSGGAGDRMQRAERAIANGANRSRAAVQDKLVRARDASLNFAEQKPMAMAFGTLLAGIGIGLLLPTSQRERRLIEPAREKLRNAFGDARGVAQEIGSMAKETANDAMHVIS